MGFDIECIIDIHTYPGEYFCPVCRTLVYPNEALQSQCTHLYCKPCLAHVANNTRACPYDGYLVTEADSKVLLEADKALAENIGKVKVRCLYNRSGCTWEGTLSESCSHCSGCAFGNSPVICNRCGVQIVHRQVHDHAQTCPGVYQAQQASVQDPATSSSAAAAPTATATATATPTSTSTATGDQNQAVAQSTASTSQALNSQTTAARLLGVQDPNQQGTANTQAPAVAPTAAPTPEQWYQQYYQQYAGYDHYHQSYQQYYPYQQQAAQQYQQGQGQYHAQVYSQTQSQPQVQTQVQPQVQPQVPVQPLPQPQPQLQPQSQSLQKVQTQSHAQGQAPVQGQHQPQSHGQTIALQYQNLAQVNPQPPPLQTHAQANPTPQPQPYPQPPPHPILSQPHVQMPQYQQPHLQMQHPHVSQSSLQPNRNNQPQSSSQSQTQPQPLIQPQAQIQNYPQSYPQTHPQINQPPVPNVQQQSSLAAPGVTGHQSYQPPQQMPVGTPQQQPVHPRPMTASLPMHGQIPQQPPLARPPLLHGPVFNQQASVPPVGQMPSIPPAHQQQFYPHAQPPGQPVQQHPGIQPIQQPLPQAPQNFSGPVQGPFGHFGQQQPMQTQLRPQGAPHVMQPAPHGYTLSNQNVALAPGVQPQQSQNYAGGPSVPTFGLQPQSFPQSSGGFGAAAYSKPLQLASNQPFGNENYAKRTSSAPDVSERTAQVQGGTPIMNSGEKDIKVHMADSIDLKAAKSETGVKDENETVDKTRDRSELSETLTKEAQKDGSGEPLIQQTLKEEPKGCSLDLRSVENTSGTSAMEDKDGTSFASKELLKQKDISSGLDKDSKAAPTSASDQNGSDKKDSRSAFMVKDESQHYGNDSSSQHSGHSSYQQKFTDPLMSHANPSSGPPPRPQASGYGPTSLRPQGPELMFPALPLNPSEHSQPPLLKQPPDAPFGGFAGPGSIASFGGGCGIFGPPPRSFEPPPAAQRPPLPGVPPGSIDPRSGIMGRVPLHGPEGQFGVQDPINPVENDMSQNQRLNRIDGSQLNTHLPGTLERGPFGRPSSIESNSRMLGPAGFESTAYGMRDERFIPRPGEHMNPFAMELIRPIDQAPRPLDKVPPGPNYDGLKSDPGASGPPSRFMPPPHHAGVINPDVTAERELPVGVHEDYRVKTDPARARARADFLKPDPSFGRRHMDHLTPRSPGREYFGIPPRGSRSFGEGPGSFNLPPDPVGNSFPDNRFQTFSGHLQRIEPDCPENMRFGERVAPSHHNSQLRSGNRFDQDILPGHLRRGEMLGPRNFPGHFRLGEPADFSAFPGRGSMEELGRGYPHHFPGGESFRGNHSNVPHHGEPGFRRNDGLYADPFDKSRKRKPVSMGWCRICKIDCETVEGLDIHSQSRDHQRMAMDMVKSIKQQNKKKSKLSGDRSVVEGANKARNTGFEGRGNKP